MKAKNFAKIRARALYYRVDISISLFGVFTDTGGTAILAYSHKHAAERYRKRYYIDDCVGDETTERFGYYRVKLSTAVNHPRHYKYY